MKRGAITSLVVLAACGGGSRPPTASSAPPCDDRSGQVLALTGGPGDDEDGAFILADDGTLDFAFISNRNGTIDTWMTSSRNAVDWAEPRPVVATPADDLLNSATRTSDGLFHLTGRTGFMVGDSTSSDRGGWTAPAAWTDPRSLGWTAGYFQEAPGGAYWLVTLSDRTGTRKLYIQRSTDRGRTWDAPRPLTSHGQADNLFGFRIAADGTFILAWEQRDPRDVARPSSDSSNVYAATSRDGVTWTAPVLLSPGIGRAKFDIWPSLIVGPGNVTYATWLSSRVGSPSAPGVVMVPVHPTLNVNDMRLVPASGYSVRSQRLADGRHLIAWVQTNATNGSKDYFYRFACTFDFPRVN